jgi:hypothetical protein
MLALLGVGTMTGSASDVYRASQIKGRRSTKSQIEARRDALLQIIEAMRPMTVRQVFYQATICGIVEKTEGGYQKVQTDLVLLRRNSELPYAWLADNTRWQRRPATYNDIGEALRETARLYRKSLWRDADAYVEIWIEKDALSGVIFPITALYDVSLMVARGYASLSFLHSSAEYIAELDVPAFIYHLGTTIPLVSTRARRSKKPCGSWHLTPKSTSSETLSPASRLPNGVCQVVPRADRPARRA